MLFGKYVNRFYKKYFWFFFVGVISLIVVDFAQVLIPYMFGDLIDGINGKESSLLYKFDGVSIYVIILLVVAITMLIGRFLWRYCVIGTSHKIEGDLRYDLFNHSLKLSVSYYKEHKIGALMALYTNDLMSIRQTFGLGMVAFVDMIFLGIFALIMMIITNPLLTLMAVVPMIIIVISAVIVEKKLKEKFLKRQEAYDMLSDFSEENFSGIFVIKAFVKEKLELKHFDIINKDNYIKNIQYVRYSTLLDTILTLLISVIFVVLFAGGSYFVNTHQVFFGNEFTAGNMVKFVGFFDILIWPFLAISLIIRYTAEGKTSYKRIEEFLDSKVEINDDLAKDLKELKGNIKFNHLSFKYPDSKDIYALKDISFEINQGEMVGIIGKTGSGKTTIVDLLLRTYNVEKNSILIDGTDIMEIPYKVLRDNIGYVPQDNFLFSDSIINNIAFAYDYDKKPSYEEVRNAAKLAYVDTNIDGFTNKYETILGERGVTLSGGQKQRVSIARALIKDPLILILDDSVSAVDTETEATILSNLRKERKNKTTIFVAHRISTIESLDKIIVIDDGMVSGVGTHLELLKTNKLYQEMVHLQNLETKIENGGDTNAD